MAVTRPLKEGSVTTYQAKVAAGFPDILASEMDADLDTIYAAWNGGVGTANLGDGSVTAAKLAPDAQFWSLSGATLVPTDATRTVTIAPTADNNPLIFGRGTIKGRLVRHPAANAVYLTSNTALNTGTVWVQDNAAKPGWILQLDSDTDQLILARSAPGGSPGSIFSVTNAGALVAGHVQPTGTATGLRCQNVGVMSGDGYSNAIAFGFDAGLIKARVDGTQMGSVNLTAPSDARLKTDVQPDVPGLDAVRALRPVSFAYDQTARAGGIGFPAGRHYGLIAQEAQPILPLIVDDDGTADHYLSIDYRRLVPVLLQAVQELATRVDGLTA
jgi:hypothetical protein